MSAGHRTGCGNPDWLATHPPARVSAVCVEQLLAAGAACTGKTISDEVAFSLLGENVFYGTPLNPAAPDRVPGGSSSGSASAVARGLVDFALGTDTGGSVRIPASYCGLWGMRPTHGLTSLAGVMPFSPSFDTIGVLARTADVLQRAMGVLLGREAPSPATRRRHRMFTYSREPLALCDADVRQALEGPLDRVREIFPDAVRETSLQRLLGDTQAADLSTWLNTFRTLRSAEVDSCLGPWVEAVRPKFGPSAAAGFEIIRQMDRSQIGPAIYEREHLAQRTPPSPRPARPHLPPHGAHHRPAQRHGEPRPPRRLLQPNPCAHVNRGHRPTAPSIDATCQCLRRPRRPLLHRPPRRGHVALANRANVRLIYSRRLRRR